MATKTKKSSGSPRTYLSSVINWQFKGPVCQPLVIRLLGFHLFPVWKTPSFQFKVVAFLALPVSLLWPCPCSLSEVPRSVKCGCSFDSPVSRGKFQPYSTFDIIFPHQNVFCLIMGDPLGEHYCLYTVSVDIKPALSLPAIVRIWVLRNVR